MRVITKNLTLKITGANAAVAAETAVKILVGTEAAIKAGQTFVEFGKDLGKSLFEMNNPDYNLGPMTYDKKDYGTAYFDHKNPKSYNTPQHYNNANDFHSSFGNF